MDEQPAVTQKLGLLDDPEGGTSSGRFIKIGSFFMASILGIALIFCLFTHTKDNPSDSSTVTAISIAIGSFLAVAAGSEAIQKFTRT